MDATHQPLVFLAMASQARAEALAPLVEAMGLEPMIISDVESLLFHTRTTIPAALVLEYQLIRKVAQLDLIVLLRQRKQLVEMPLICLGPNNAAINAAVLTSGADVYIAMPTHPSVIEANLNRLWERRQTDISLRNTLKGLREMEGAFKESERMKDDLTHMLVHDLKSPIASVMGLLDHSVDMLQGLNDMATPLELLTLARVEAQHLLNLAANILDVRRMKEGHMPYKPQKVASLTDIAKKALQDVSGQNRERNFSFLVRPEAEAVYADPELLRRILANLFSNGVKHTRRDGYIDFRAWKQEDTFILSMRDDGEGIPEADQKRIFNAFEQSRHTVHDRYDTGMGLTFCKLAVEKHGGKIWVESKVGRGSTFFFTLPADISDEVLNSAVIIDSEAVT